MEIAIAEVLKIGIPFLSLIITKVIRATVGKSIDIDRFLPIVSTVAGTVAGTIGGDMAAGVVGGLAATGLHQTFKQIDG